MKTAIAKLKSASPYSQSCQHFTPKEERELADAFEKRTWREKVLGAMKLMGGSGSIAKLTDAVTKANEALPLAKTLALFQ